MDSPNLMHAYHGAKNFTKHGFPVARVVSNVSFVRMSGSADTNMNNREKINKDILTDWK